MTRILATIPNPIAIGFRDKGTKDHEENSYIFVYRLNILNPYVKCVLSSIIFVLIAQRVINRIE